MKITKVEVIPLVRKLEEAFAGGTYRIVNRNTLVTRVHTDQGIVGQAFGGDEDQRQMEVVKIIREKYDPLLQGEDARNVERLWNKMYQCPTGLDNRSIHVLDLNNHAIQMQAIAAVDNALWDALGKFYNVPLYKLLGGYRDKVPIIAIGGYYKDGQQDSDIRDEILSYKALELSGVKFKVGRKNVAEDVERVRIAREAVGDDFMIACDANQAWTPAQAIEFCRAAAPLNIRWIEEPVRWDDQNEGLRLVRQNSPIPVSAGQGEITRYGCRDLILHGNVNILNVDVTIAGGVTEWLKIAHLAEHFHVQMGHHEEAQVALHLLAAIPHSLYVEIFPNPKRDPMWAELPVVHPRIKGGYMELPPGPGLGMDLNEDVIARYRVDQPMVSEIIIPVMDQATETVLLTGWRKQEGEPVRKGEPICDIETEKASVEIEAAASGVLRKTLAAAGDRVAPRTVIGLIAEANEALPDLAQYAQPPAGAPASAAASPMAAVTAPMSAPTSPVPGGRVMASPRAKRLAEEHGIDLKTVHGTGPDGRIQEEDVQAAIKAAADPSARVARAKAERVSLSWRTIPHFYTTITVDMSQAGARKARIGQGATYTDFIVLALGQVLAKYPAFNGYWKDEAAVAVDEIRLGLVVQAERGLLVAVLRDLRRWDWDSLAAERERAVQQALAGKQDAGAGEPTFTLSNIGPGHIDHFSAIINPPQVAILSVGSIQPRPVVVGDALTIRPTAGFTLGVDHRAIDGRQSAAFLEELKLVLETPE